MTGGSKGTERELGVSVKINLGVRREEKCNILFFRLPTQNELLLFSYLDFNGFIFSNRGAKRLARNRFPFPPT